MFSKIPAEEKKRFRTLEKQLGYSFGKKEILKKALTHKSYANEKRLAASSQNERLEFLGDAVLELSVSEFLMERFPDYSEGDLSKLRAGVVNEKQLAELARRLELGNHLFLGRGEEQTSGREKNSLLADAFEALLGGIYLDGGYKKVKKVIFRQYGSLLERNPVTHFYRDYKTDLQERSQAMFRSIPRYRLISERGPDHDKIFEVELSIRDRVLGKGSGRSKKEAEQVAACRALVELGESVNE